MYDLISRQALLAAYDERHKGPPGGARELIEDAPSVPAVPLDNLCEWLSSHAYKKTGYYITDPGEARYAHEWEHDIKEWMEEQDATD